MTVVAMPTAESEAGEIMAILAPRYSPGRRFSSVVNALWSLLPTFPKHVTTLLPQSPRQQLLLSRMLHITRK
jgi:hypothetical protein